jgi:predicted RNA-binding protein YlxR (DUF448 family)
MPKMIVNRQFFLETRIYKLRKGKIMKTFNQYCEYLHISRLAENLDRKAVEQNIDLSFVILSLLDEEIKNETNHDRMFRLMAVKEGFLDSVGKAIGRGVGAVKNAFSAGKQAYQQTISQNDAQKLQGQLAQSIQQILKNAGFDDDTIKKFTGDVNEFMGTMITNRNKAAGQTGQAAAPAPAAPAPAAPAAPAGAPPAAPAGAPPAAPTAAPAGAMNIAPKQSGNQAQVSGNQAQAPQAGTMDVSKKKGFLNPKAGNQIT